MGMNVNLKNYRELYEKALTSGDWHLEGGDVKNSSAWGERKNMTMQTQTMVLEANRRYYQSNKFDKWFKPDREVETEMETEPPSDPNKLTLKMTEPVQVVSTTTETETETELPFDPALATLELIGAVGDVLADPFFSTHKCKRFASRRC